MNCLPKILNSSGLALDVTGALLLWKYALPLFHRFKNGFYGHNTGMSEDIKKNKFVSGIGMFLLITGFLLQLLSNWIQ